MNILVVDNKPGELNHTVNCLKSLYPQALLIPFEDAMDAVRYGYNHPVDVLYTEVTMRHITGFDVVRLLRKKHPEVRAFFISDSEEYLKLSIQNGGKGYYLKPVDAESLLHGNRITGTA